jgi:hypothetical protein
VIADDPGETRVGSVSAEELLDLRKELRGDRGHGNSTFASRTRMWPPRVGPELLKLRRAAK